MKQYTVIADSKNHEFSESFVINAKNYKDAQKIGRRQCRHENMIFVAVKLRK